MKTGIMERPQVRIVEQPQVQNVDVSVSQSEADYLLAKYGFKSPAPVPQPQHHPPADNRTFDEMVRDHEARIQAERARRDRPRAITFDDSSVVHSETRWSDLGDDVPGYGIQVTVVTDMKF
jgi:hypothetical protein